jgi:hypothetical protein
MTKKDITVFFTLLGVIGVICIAILIYPYIRNTEAPFQLGTDQFDELVLSHSDIQKHSEWEVYVAPGSITTGWLWFKKETPVVYYNVTYLGKPNIRNLVIKYGDQKIEEPEFVTGAGTGFYMKTSRIPQVMDISWMVGNKQHHIKIDAKSMVQLSWIDGSS